MGFVTEDDWPDRLTPEQRKARPSRSVISNTHGIWVRRMNNGDYELYDNGKFIASWGGFSEHVACAMIELVKEYAFKEGRKAQVNDLRRAIGEKEI